MPFFFFKLGQFSLVSWDEAWYGEIAKNILKDHNLIYLSFNGNLYNDHPPVGFWFIALSQVIFGINEFGTRFAPALAGFLTLIVTFLLGRNLFNPLAVFTFYISLSQIRANWYQFIDIPIFTSDEEILSLEASRYDYPYYIEGDFIPAAFFYWRSQELVHSDRKVKRVTIESLGDLFKNEPAFLLNTKVGILKQYGILPTQYRIIKTDRDRVLVIKDD